MTRKSKPSVVWLRAATIAALILAGSAMAQPKPALVQDRDTAARDPVQVTKSSFPIDCTSSSCSISFADYTVPTGKRLVVTQVNVKYAGAVASPTGFEVALIAPPGATSLTFRGPSGPSSGGVVLQPLTFYVEAGQFLLVSVYADNDVATMSANVTLTGYWVTLP
jgi:hypothetical protein